MQLSNTCFWDVLKSVRWSVQRGPQFLITDSIQQVGPVLHQTPCSIKHWLSKEIADHLRALVKLAPLLFAEQYYKPTTSSHSHHIETEKEKGEESTPFGAAASSNGALPTPSGLSQQYSLPLGDVGRKTKDTHTTHTIRAQSHRHGLCRVRRLRSRFGAALLAFKISLLNFYLRAANVSLRPSNVQLDSCA